MENRSHSRRGQLVAVETGDGERVECDGVLDLLDQFCKSVNNGGMPHRAILVHLAWAFEQVLLHTVTMDEAFGLKPDRSGRRPRYKGRQEVLCDKEARGKFWRDKRLARLVSQHLQSGRSITRAYEYAMKIELKQNGNSVSLATVRRAWKKHSEEHQWIMRLEPARRVLTMKKCQEANRLILKFLPKLESRAARLEEARRDLAPKASRLCGVAYGQAVGANEYELVEELLWDQKQLFGPRQYLATFLGAGLITEKDARENWRQGFREGAGLDD